MNFICAWCLFDSYSNVLVFDGDSITNGVPNMSPWRMFLNTLPASWLNLNIAVGAQTVQQMGTNATANVVSQFKSGGKNVVFVWAGTNDGANGRTAAQAWADAINYASIVRAAGFKAIFITMLSRNGQDTFKNSYNALALANWPGNFDAIVDLTGISQISADGSFSNATYFLQTGLAGVHPTTLAAQTLIAPAAQTVLNAFL